MVETVGKTTVVKPRSKASPISSKQLFAQLQSAPTSNT